MAGSLDHAGLHAWGGPVPRYLKKFFLTADLVPQHFQSEGLIDALKPFAWKGQQVWLPQAEEPRGILEQTLTRLGQYRPCDPGLPQRSPRWWTWTRLSKLLQKGELDWITFSSSSTVRNFFELLPDAGRIALRKQTPRVACIGEITAATARQYQLDVTLIPERQNIEGLVEALCGASRRSS